LARRIPLPRLTRRQRLTRWQRERRQQAIIVTAFTTVLFFVLGLVAWSSATGYYEENLKPAARIGDRDVPMRDFNRRFTFEKVRLIPEEYANDPQVLEQANSLRKGVLDSVVMGETLLTVAREEGTLPSAADVDARLAGDFGEVHVRHILVKPDEAATDKEKADADAKAKAQELATQLKADAKNEQLWKDLAARESKDDGTKDQGGDLGWVSRSSGFVKEFEDAMYALEDGAVSDPVKSSFGYHVIQRIESRTATQTPTYTRLKRVGIGLEDLRGYARANLLRERYEKKLKDAEVPSPQEQVHLAVIVIRVPPPTNFEAYPAALKKINDVRDALEKGRDFGDVAKEFSDDLDTNQKGGDLGWMTRAMLPNKIIADDVFKRAAGEQTEQHSLNDAGDLATYKILEKDPARAVTDEQKVKIREEVFTLWLKDQEERLDVLRLIPGLEF
jgi:parvulin-like peptidyl-prolyl isomerase